MQWDTKSPQPVLRRGLNSCDVEYMQVICPTCQVRNEMIFEMVLHRLALRKRINKSKCYRLTERVNLRIELRSGSAEASSPSSEMNGPADGALLSIANAGGLSIPSRSSRRM
jgi:hypothetical protein